MTGRPALRPYQQTGAGFLAARRFAVLGDACGLGKTPQFLAAAAGYPRVLILAPAATLPGLAREVARWTGREAIALDHAGKVRPPPVGPCLVLLPWTSARVRLVAVTSGARWDVVVLDEAHFIKSPDSQRTRAVLGQWRTVGGVRRRAACVVGHADRVWATTATPIPNRPIELQPLFYLGGGITWAHRDHFGARYCEQPNKFSPTGYDYNGAKNLDELRRRLDAEGILLRRLPEDVPGELPALSVSVVPLDGVKGPPPPPGSLDPATLTGALDAPGGGPLGIAFEEMSAYRAAMGAAKVPAVVAWLRDWLEAGDRSSALVVFCWHREVAHGIAAAFPDGAAWVATGDQSPAARQAMVDRFAAGERRIFIASIAACGTGLNGLHRRTTECAFAEAPWAPEGLIQAIGRVRRFGSASALTVAHLLTTPDTLEDHILRTVAGKLAVAATILGDARGETPLTPSPDPVTPPPTVNGTPSNKGTPAMSENTINLVPMSDAEREALRQLPALLHALSQRLALPPAAVDAAAGVRPVTPPAGTPPPPANNEATAAAAKADADARIAAEARAKAEAAARMEAEDRAREVERAKAAGAAAAAAGPVVTLDQLRAACAAYGAAKGGTAAALARLNAFAAEGIPAGGARKVGDIPEASRPAFLAWMAV